MRELDGVDKTFWTDDVRNMGDSCTRSGTKVKNLKFLLKQYKSRLTHLLAWAHVNVIDTTENSGSQLGAEGVP